MEIWLNEKQKRLQRLAREIAREKVLPIREYFDETEEFPREVVKEFALAGFFEVLIPKEYGGGGGGLTEICIITEELSRICGGTALSFAGTALGINPILLFGNEEQKNRYLPSGESDGPNWLYKGILIFGPKLTGEVQSFSPLLKHI